MRTYPASGATVLLPLTPSNNYAATILMCGGQDITNWQFSSKLANQFASGDCVRITPDSGSGWSEDAGLPEGRIMGNFIILPDGKIFLTSGARQGVCPPFVFPISPPSLALSLSLSLYVMVRLMDGWMVGC